MRIFFYNHVYRIFPNGRKNIQCFHDVSKMIIINCRSLNKWWCLGWWCFRCFSISTNDIFWFEFQFILFPVAMKIIRSLTLFLEKLFVIDCIFLVFFVVNLQKTSDKIIWYLISKSINNKIINRFWDRIVFAMLQLRFKMKWNETKQNKIKQNENSFVSFSLANFICERKK